MAAAGIDAEKTVMSLQTKNGHEILAFYCWKGYDYVVVEGFKEEGFPSVVIGDLPAGNVVLRNADVLDVFEKRDMFAEYVPAKR